MDLHATLASPLRAVFARLADPSRLGDWLPEVTAVEAGPPGAVGAGFPLTIWVGEKEVAGTGEVTAFEPPWLAGYRLFAGGRVYGLRITCAAHDGGTRVHVRQSGDGPPLAVDLARLARAITRTKGEG